MAHDIIRAVTDHMLIEVGTMLLENKATLLPTICSSFIQHAKHVAVRLGMPEPPELKMVNSRWISCEIISKYQHHVTYSCKVRKHGTLVYRPTSDLIALLSEALWKLKQVHSEPVRTEGHQDTTPASTNSSTELIDTCSIGDFNKLVHGQIDSYLSTHDNALQDYDEFNIDGHISNVDPQLWSAIHCITRSKSEIRGTSKAIDPTSQAFHVKKVRRFFLLCAIMFNTDDRSSMPMHTLLTDIVESQGGSSVLVQILNRLGVCSSADTLARFIQHKRGTSEQHQFRCMSKDAFTVISADNLDFMHSFARVFCGKQQSSWHGTTVQVVQPLPSLSLISTHTDSASITQDTAPHTSVTNTSPSEDDSVSLTDVHITTHGENTGASHDSQEEMSASQTGRPSASSVDHELMPVTRKRLERSSPFPSPMKLTRSPLAKIPRRLRTGTEGSTPQTTLPTHLPEPTYHHHCHRNDSTLADFICNSKETQSQADLQHEMNVYLMHRVAFQKSSCTHPFLGLQNYYALTRPSHTEKSHVMYLDVLDAVADRKETMMGLLHSLRKTFIEERKNQWLILEGDAKLYEILKSLHFEYGEELRWLIPYPGDFHLLMNYQKALMKPYYDAGLKAMAQAAGYPLSAIQTCSQFKRTHHFILEAWEAIYRVMIIKYEEESPATTYLSEITDELLAMSTENFLSAFNQYIASQSTKFQHYFDNFREFIQTMARTDDTWRFWVQFIFEDAMAYISLFLAIRSGDWELRLASVKAMAAVFTAFDHPTYQKLISQHLEDIATMPSPIITMFRQGAFVVSITGRPWHSVGIDESHEMLIVKCPLFILYQTISIV